MPQVRDAVDPVRPARCAASQELAPCAARRGSAAACAQQAPAGAEADRRWCATAARL